MFASAQILLKPVNIATSSSCLNAEPYSRGAMLKLKPDRKALGKGGAICEKKFIHYTHPVAYFKKCHVLRVACWIQKSVEQCFLHVIVMSFSYILQRNSSYHSVCLPFKSVLCSSRVHCARCVISGYRLFIARHRYIAIVSLASSLSSCFNSPVTVRARLCFRRHRREQREEEDEFCNKTNKSGSDGRCPARLACTTLEHSGGKHLGCGRFLADQTLCQVKEKKKDKKKGRARGNRTLQTVLGRLEHLYNPNEVRLDA